MIVSAFRLSPQEAASAVSDFLSDNRRMEFVVQLRRTIEKLKQWSIWKAHAEHAEQSGWELMGTLTCEPIALAQLRPELEAMGDSLLITPLDMAVGLWALHVHVPDIDPARELIMGYGQWSDERISSLADGRHADHACGAEGGA